MYNLIFGNREVLITPPISKERVQCMQLLSKDSELSVFAKKIPSVTLIMRRIKTRCLLVELYRTLS